MPRSFHLKHRTRLLAVAWLLACSGGEARADWLDDIGRTRLAAELGATMPLGTGIELLQSEANSIASPPNYLPQAGGPDAFSGAGVFLGKNFHPKSGAGTELGHAIVVGSFFYGTNSGVARGATEIHNYTAIDFILRLLSGIEPEVFPGRVQNHSWAGSLGDQTDDLNAVRAFDYMIDRDARIATIGMSGGMLAPLLGSNYHAITAGVRSGSHSQSGTTTDGPGRMKPDLVVNTEFTSYAAPAIGGTAACLLQQAIANGNPNAERPQSLKAILLASASKQNLPQWQRDAAGEPYDDVFGAGELDFYHAWHLLQAGEQDHSTTTERSIQGWDFDTTTTSSGGRRYFFTIPAGGVAETFSAALTWHREVTDVAGVYSSSLPDLTLKLYASTALVPGGLISESTSALDKVEHLFLRHLPPGQYCLEVTSNTDAHDFAIAWQALLGQGPRLDARPSAGNVILDASSLDPQAVYTLESAPDLTSAWTTVETFRTADGTPSFQHSTQTAAGSTGRKFFRLRWTPVQ